MKLTIQYRDIESTEMLKENNSSDEILGVGCIMIELFPSAW